MSGGHHRLRWVIVYPSPLENNEPCKKQRNLFTRNIFLFKAHTNLSHTCWVPPAIASQGGQPFLPSLPPSLSLSIYISAFLCNLLMYVRPIRRSHVVNGKRGLGPVLRLAAVDSHKIWIVHACESRLSSNKQHKMAVVPRVGTC